MAASWSRTALLIVVMALGSLRVQALPERPPDRQSQVLDFIQYRIQAYVQNRGDLTAAEKDSLRASCRGLIAIESAWVEFERQDLAVGVYQVYRTLPSQDEPSPDAPKTLGVSQSAVRVFFKGDHIDQEVSQIEDLESLLTACAPVISGDLPAYPCLAVDGDCYATAMLRPVRDDGRPILVPDYRVLIPDGDPDLPSQRDWIWQWNDTTWDDLDPIEPRAIEPLPENPTVVPEVPNPLAHSVTPMSSFESLADDFPCQKSRLVAPVFENRGASGQWSVRPLANVLITKGRYAFRTEADGTFCAPLEKTLKVHLRNGRFVVFGLDGLPVTQKFAGREAPSADNNPPYVLSSRGDPWQEIEHASALYFHLSQVLDFFESISPPTGLDRPLHVHLTAALDGSECRAQMTPGTLRLPLVCRSDRFFEPKALCPEIITHEAAHEYFNRLLYASLGNSDLGVHLELGETLADFIAMVYQDDPILGRFCSGEIRRTPFEQDSVQLKYGQASSGSPGDLQLPGDTWKIAFQLWQLSEDLADGLHQHTAFRPVEANPHLSTARDMRHLITRCLLSALLWGGEEATHSPKAFLGKLFEFVELFDQQGSYGGKLIGAFRARLSQRPKPAVPGQEPAPVP